MVLLRQARHVTPEGRFNSRSQRCKSCHCRDATSLSGHTPYWKPRFAMLPTLSSLMTSSNGNIFRVTGPSWGDSPVTGEFHAQRSATRSFDVFFDLSLNKWLRKRPRCRWLETPSCSSWRHYSEWQFCHHWWYRRLPYWQPRVAPMTTNLALIWLSFSVIKCHVKHAHIL